MKKRNGLLLLLSLLWLTGLHAQTPDEITSIEFITATRGYQKQITINSKTITVKLEDHRQQGMAPVVREMKKQDWDHLLESLKDVTLAEIPLLKSPSMQRASDGARSSSIAITTNEGVIWSHEFDNERPHEKLQSLIDVITALDKD